jgi:hypothetical protein
LTIGKEENKFLAVGFVSAGSLMHVVKATQQAFPYVCATIGIQRIQSSINLL